MISFSIFFISLYYLLSSCFLLDFRAISLWPLFFVISVIFFFLLNFCKMWCVCVDFFSLIRQFLIEFCVGSAFTLMKTIHVLRAFFVYLNLDSKRCRCAQNIIHLNSFAIPTEHIVFIRFMQAHKYFCSIPHTKKKLYLKRIYDKCKKNGQLLRSVSHNGMSLFYRQTIDLIVEITFKIKCYSSLFVAATNCNLSSESCVLMKYTYRCSTADLIHFHQFHA